MDTLNNTSTNPLTIYIKFFLVFRHSIERLVKFSLGLTIKSQHSVWTLLLWHKSLQKLSYKKPMDCIRQTPSLKNNNCRISVRGPDQTQDLTAIQNTQKNYTYQNNQWVRQFQPMSFQGKPIWNFKAFGHYSNARANAKIVGDNVLPWILMTRIPCKYFYKETIGFAMWMWRYWFPTLTWWYHEQLN